VVICLERGADLHMAQLMPLPLTVFCFSKIQIGIAFLVPAYLGSPGKRAVKTGVCVASVNLLIESLIASVATQVGRLHNIGVLNAQKIIININTRVYYEEITNVSKR